MRDKEERQGQGSGGQRADIGQGRVRKVVLARAVGMLPTPDDQYQCPATGHGSASSQGGGRQNRGTEPLHGKQHNHSQLAPGSGAYPQTLPRAAMPYERGDRRQQQRAPRPPSSAATDQLSDVEETWVEGMIFRSCSTRAPEALPDHQLTLWSKQARLSRGGLARPASSVPSSATAQHSEEEQDGPGFSGEHSGVEEVETVRIGCWRSKKADVPWTAAEDIMARNAHEAGNKWKRFAGVSVSGNLRTRAAIRNRWNRLQRIEQRMGGVRKVEGRMRYIMKQPAHPEPVGSLSGVQKSKGGAISRVANRPTVRKPQSQRRDAMTWVVTACETARSSTPLVGSIFAKYDAGDTIEHDGHKGNGLVKPQQYADAQLREYQERNAKIQRGESNAITDGGPRGCSAS